MHSLNSSTLTEALDAVHRAAFHAAPVGMAIVAPDGRLVAANDALARILGMTEDALLDEGLHTSVHPAERAADRVAWERVRVGADESQALEQRRTRGDGAVIHTRMRRSAMRGSDGEIEFVLFVIEETAGLEPALSGMADERRTMDATAQEDAAITAVMHDVVLVLDIDGRYLRVPQVSPGHLYAPAEQLVGRLMHDVLPAPTADKFLMVIRRALESRGAVSSEYALPIDGRMTWFSAVVSPISSDRVVWVSRDITDERAAAASLRLSEQRYRLLFDGNPVPMWVYDLHTLRFLDVNEAAVRNYGYSREEFAAMTIADIRPPEDRPALRRSVGDSAREPHRAGVWRHLHKDGTLIEVEITAHPFRHEGREGELVLAHDVSLRRRAEQELRETTSLLQAVVDDSPLAIVTVDLDLKVTRWNPAAERMLGWSAEEMAGRYYDSIIPADREDTFPQSWERALAGGEFARFGTYYRRKDGTRVDVDISVAALHASDGTVTGVMLILADMTAQRLLEAQLRQSQKMEVVGQLAGGVAHDFNNLLTAITGYSDLLLQDVDTADPRREDVLEIKQAADRAAALTRQLLAFSRQQVVQPRKVFLNGLIQRLQKMMRRLVREDIEIQLVMDPSAGRVEADPGQLEQVIINIVLNARDAIEGCGRITIETSAAPGMAALESGLEGAGPAERSVVLKISDSGTGMSPETAARIFEPFFTTKDVGKGTGLGLATVYGIVTQARGRIAVDSVVGKGSVFTMHFPMVESDEPSAPETLAPAPTIEPGDKVILLVEDEGSVRLVGRRILERSGYTVLEASSGAQALALMAARGAPVDLLVTDMVMPGMSGPALVEHLRARTPELRVLYVSGYSRDAIDQKVVFSAGNDYLEKPFTADSLSSTVCRLLRTS